MAASIRAFWWSPLRFPGLLRAELKANARMWYELGKTSHRTLANFGDELTPLLLKTMSGRDIVWTKPEKADVICLGSILELYAECGGRNAIVMGCGLRSAINDSSEATQKVLHDLQYVAVRGPLTSNSLGLEGMCEADPGVLSNRLDFERLRGGVIGPIFIPHFRHWATADGRSEIRRLQSIGIRVVSPSLSPKTVLSAISGASVVYSSSLHGLICSHSLGIPAVLVGQPRVGDRESEFKYVDYYRSVSVELPAPISIGQILTVDAEDALGEAKARTSELKNQTESMGDSLMALGLNIFR